MKILKYIFCYFWSRKINHTQTCLWSYISGTNLEIYQIVEIYPIKANGILQFVSFIVLGHFQEVKRDIKEGNESIKGDVKNVGSDIKGMIKATGCLKQYVKDSEMGIKKSVEEAIKEGVQSMKEDVKDIKKDIKEDVKEGVKEGVQSMKEVFVEDIKNDFKEGVKSMKEEVVQDIKRDVKEGVNEVVEVIKERTKNMEKLEMKEDYTRKSMENIERGNFTYPRVPALGELYLIDFVFALNMKLSP